MIKNMMVMLFMITFISCGNVPGGDANSTRPFLMGFTPWPYDQTTEAVDWTYDHINDNGDILSHHMEEGVPWPEAYSDSSFPNNFQTGIDSRVSRYRSGKKVVLSVSPLNMGRDGMALYRGSEESMALPSPWDTYALNSTPVKTAYLNYVMRMVESFQPDYLIIGVEVNLLIRNNPALWDPYVELQDYVYQNIKTDYPDLPVGVSVFCVPYFPEWSPEDNLESQLTGLDDLEPSADFIAFSVHPFMSALTAESFPSDYMQRLFALTDKPVAVSESSYPAQFWQTVNDPVIDFNGTQEKQNAFLSSLLEESAESNALFVIWFSVRDFDALWEGVLAEDPLGLVWRDTGLYDEDGNGRSALTVWRNWFGRIYSD